MNEGYKATGAEGEYKIRHGGYHPEAGDFYRYEDKQRIFWFYVDVKTNFKQLTMVVNCATAERLAGAGLQFPPLELKTIEDNIRRYFVSVDIVGRPRSSADPAPNVIFSWKFPS